MGKLYLILLGGALGLVGLPVFSDPAADQDLEFAAALITMGFPDYAEKLANRLLKQDPGLNDRVQSIKIRVMIAYRKFAEAEALVKAMPKDDPQAQDKWRAIANGYLQANDLQNAKRIYTELLAQPAESAPQPAGTNNTFMLEAAYRVAQILEKSGDFAGALQAYDRVLLLTDKTDTTLLSKFQCAQANLYLKRAQALTGAQQTNALESAKKLCSTVIWRGVDLYFCQAVIVLAQLDLLRGDRDAARKKITDNKATIQKLDEYLRKQKDDDKLPLALSPMAVSFYLLGKIDQEQGEALLEQSEEKAPDQPKPKVPEQPKPKTPEPAKAVNPGQNKEKGIELLFLALKEFNAVVTGYRESEWAPDAALRAQAVRGKLKELGKDVAPEPAGMLIAPNRAVLAEIKAADALFYSQTNYPQAQSAYLGILTGYPDTTNSPRVLKNLAICCLNQKDNLITRATAQYLAERFCGDPQAGNLLLQIGRACRAQQNLDMLAGMYATFLDNFPRHDSVPAVLFSLAMIRNQQGDETGAARFMQRIIDDYPNDPNCLKAYEQTAWWRYKDKKYAQAIEYFKKFIAENRDEKLRPQAQFGLANCYLSMEQFAAALTELKALKASLETSPADQESSLSAERLQQQKETLEQTCYLTAFCLSRIDSPAAALPGYRDEAIALAGQFMKAYPQSAWASRMMSLQGTTQLDRGQISQAVETFDQLAERYPHSPEGNNALVSLVQAALTVKKHEVAQDAFEKMKANRQFYLNQGKEASFAYIGRLMFDAGQYPAAIGAYQIVTTSATTNKHLLENAFFYLGRACCETAHYPEAVTALNALLTRYPQSAFYYDAKFLLGRAYRELGQSNKVYEMLNDVAARATNIVLINKASLELSKTQLNEGKKKEALASLMRVTLLADVNNPELRPMVEEALLESLKLYREFNGRKDVIDTCRQYLAKFPKGAQAAEVAKIKRETEAQAGAAGP